MPDVTPQRTFRLGDRVRLRVEYRATAHRGGWGDVIGLPWNETLGEIGDGKVFVGWADGSQSWELPIELRLASER